MVTTSTSPPPAIPGQDAVKPANRLPSLNALAARINLNNKEAHGPTPASTTNANAIASANAPAPRPRLVASVLRTASSVSISTVASAADSMFVNPPSTRSASPSSLSVSTTHSQSHSRPQSTASSSAEGESLTADKLEKLNQETATATTATRTAAAAAAPLEIVVPTLPHPPVVKKIPVGYKNIPSLDAITARLAKTRALSVDGSAKPPEPEMIEDPKTPGVPMKAPEHPLQFSWTIFHDTKSKTPFSPSNGPTSAGSEGPHSSGPGPTAPDTGSYEAGLTVIGEFDTVESFCRYFNWLKPPSKLEKNSNYHLFKTGIKPMWEDEANANGGKWVLTMKNNPGLLDRCWSWLAMALVGEELEDGDEICGAVVSLRTKVDRIQVWTRSKDDVERLNGIGRRLVKLLDVSEADGIGLEFQFNTEDRPLPNKFLSIQAMPLTSYRSNFNPSSTGGSTHTHTHTHNKSLSGSGPFPANPSSDASHPVNVAPAAGAFGSFGIGIGGSGWRGKKGN